ncbi:MAG: hypothetical protein O3C67_05020 [Cyanobacteria bacterium]|nr:hypothetical protein [Cyanobacteriota bacterium]
MVNLPYKPPVSNLLVYPTVTGYQVKDWPNYVEALGLTAEHIPALIDLMLDETFLQFWDDAADEADLPDLEPDVPDPASVIIHAWRALGQLQAEAAIPALIKILTDYEDLEWAWEEIPVVLGMIGPAAIAPIHAVLGNPDISAGPKISLCDSFEKIVADYPDSRDRVVALLTDFLANPDNEDPDINGNVCLSLVKLKAVEAAEVMEAAYAENRVNPRMAGTWATVQVSLGLKSEEDFAPEDFALPPDPKFDAMMRDIRGYLDQLTRSQKPTAGEVGLPLDYGHWADGFGAPTFDALASPKPAIDTSSPQGFGGSAGSAKKKKKTKKKKG